MKKLYFIFIIFFLTASLLSPRNAHAVETAIISINEGWNLFSLPFALGNSVSIKASELISELGKQKGVVSSVARWNNGKWEDYVVRANNERYGADFPIELGKSYFIKSYKKTDLYIEGEKVQNPLTYSLKSGYNFVSFPRVYGYKYSSLDLAKEILSSKPSASPVISGFDFGLYKSYLYDGVKKAGQEFPIVRVSGYVIKLDSAVELKK